MSLGLSRSTTTWDVAPVSLPQPVIRETPVGYNVRSKTPLDFMPVRACDTASTDVRFWLGEIGDPLWDARSVLSGLSDYEAVYRPRLIDRPQTTPKYGSFGGRLISLAEACRLADEALFTAERERQAARERDALDWSDLEDET